MAPPTTNGMAARSRTAELRGKAKPNPQLDEIIQQLNILTNQHKPTSSLKDFKHIKSFKASSDRVKNEFELRRLFKDLTTFFTINKTDELEKPIICRLCLNNDLQADDTLRDISTLDEMRKFLFREFGVRQSDHPFLMDRLKNLSKTETESCSQFLTRVMRLSTFVSEKLSYEMNDPILFRHAADAALSCFDEIARRSDKVYKACEDKSLDDLVNILTSIAEAFPNSVGTSGQSNQTEKTFNTSKRNNISCTRCGKPNHVARDCRVNLQQTNNNDSNSCSYCGKHGHTATNCRASRRERYNQTGLPFSRPHCTFCDRLGHTADRCFSRNPRPSQFFRAPRQ